MAQLALYRDCLSDYAQLDKRAQQRVSDTFAKFENATHAGIHLEKISGMRDSPLRTIRIDQFWRGVVLAPANGDTYTLLTVLAHDEAYVYEAMTLLTPANSRDAGGSPSAALCGR